MKHYDAVVVGCGLAGSVIARSLAQEAGKKVLMLERRSHIGGNMYDYKNEAGILVHKYGPHAFHTAKRELFEYMCRYCEWKEYRLVCGAQINGKYTPSPFNFQTIDDFYDHEKAAVIKAAIQKAYPDQDKAYVLDMLAHPDPLIREYASFLFDYDYSLYTAKQWGISPMQIDPGVLKRVPVRFDYRKEYFDDAYQYMPETSYTAFFENLLGHEKIEIRLGMDAADIISLDEQKHRILFQGEEFHGIFVYTGAIDELFRHKYGSLPYRSLCFEWKTEETESFQQAPIVAYPQAEGYTRITEYTKLPVQDAGKCTTYAVEYPIPYQAGKSSEPYYPVLTKESQELYGRYTKDAEAYRGLYLCGRLAEFQYYNMDQVLERAVEMSRSICCGKL